MSAGEAAEILRRMYQEAPKGEMVAQIHLFGIKYAHELQRLSISDVVELAGISSRYVTEVSKGRKLAKYVTVRESNGY